MTYVVGVDGGNTKTIAFVVDADGRILGAGRGGNSDIYPHRTAVSAVNVIEGAVEHALDHAGLTRDQLAAGVYSLAGADWREDYDEFRDELIKRGLGQSVTVYNDAIGALRAGSPDGTGVVINAGTGAAMGARNAQGQFWHTSYWQDSLGGRDVGYNALRAVRHADIGIEPPTTLTPIVLRFFNVTTCADLLRLFTMRGSQAPSDIQVSKLAPYVLTEAANGDAVARALIIDQARRLVDYALAAARQVGIEHTPFHLVLNGGLFRHASTLLKDAVTAQIHAAAPGVTIHSSRFEPVVGAVMLALEALNIPITATLQDTLAATMPTQATFET